MYSSHCLEHMRNLDCAFTNWLRVCNWILKTSSLNPLQTLAKLNGLMSILLSEEMIF